MSAPKALAYEGMKPVFQTTMAIVGSDDVFTLTTGAVWELTLRSPVSCGQAGPQKKIGTWDVHRLERLQDLAELAEVVIWAVGRRPVLVPAYSEGSSVSSTTKRIYLELVLGRHTPQ